MGRQCSRVRRLNIVKMSIILIWSIEQNPPKKTKQVFGRNVKADSKIHMEVQNLRIAKTTLGKGEVGELLIEAQHKATVMETVSYGIKINRSRTAHIWNTDAWQSTNIKSMKKC